jgi:hypothetical protein
MEQQFYHATTLGELKSRIDAAVIALSETDPTISAFDITIHNSESNSDSLVFCVDPVELVATF